MQFFQQQVHQPQPYTSVRSRCPFCRKPGHTPQYMTRLCCPSELCTRLFARTTGITNADELCFIISRTFEIDEFVPLLQALCVEFNVPIYSFEYLLDISFL